ncbi:MAG: WecB/TagA/CpsF family glycosyltransferase [Spirochaetales bacterium]
MEGVASVLPLKRERVVGIALDNKEKEDLEQTFQRLLQTEGIRSIVFLNLWDLLRARRNKEFRRWVEQASLVLPTSLGIIKGAQFLKRNLSSRWYPFDVVIRLLRLMEEKGYSLYLLGGKHLYLQQAEKNLKQTFPGLRVVGRYVGYYPEAVEQDILLAMRKASPHCLLLGPGLKGKDLWAYNRLKELPQCIVVYSPETFDIISGKKLRPPRNQIEKGVEQVREGLRKPWRWFRGIFYLYYWILLLVYRVRKL